MALSKTKEVGDQKTALKAKEGRVMNINGRREKRKDPEEVYLEIQ